MDLFGPVGISCVPLTLVLTTLALSVTSQQFLPSKHISLGSNSDSPLIFGGIDRFRYVSTFQVTEKPYSDTLQYKRQTGTWNIIKTNRDVLSPRYSASSTQINNNLIIVFGGTDGTHVFNDIFLYDVSSSDWIRGVHAVYDGNVARWDHAAATDGSGFIYVFGGISQEGSRLGDLLQISLLSDTFWNRGTEFSIDLHRFIVSGGTTSQERIMAGDVPSPRSGHSMTFIKDAFFMFGGSSESSSSRTPQTHVALVTRFYVACAELYKLRVENVNSVRWRRINTGAVCPSPREGHVALRHGLSLLIIGGCNFSSSTPQCFNDVWQFDTESETWSNISSSFTTTFGPRMGHTALYLDQNSILITGGSNLDVDPPILNVILNWTTACRSRCTHNHGTCNEQGKCQCLDNFFGYDCGDISVSSTLHSAPCYGHGTVHLNGHCECFLGYYGANCEFGHNTCLNNCSNNGHCNDKSVCECNPGYTNPDCSVAILCPRRCCNGADCNSNGQCSCPRSYFGSSCSITEKQIHDMRSKLQSSSEKWNKLLSRVMGLLSTYQEPVPAELKDSASITAKNHIVEEKLLLIKTEIEQKLSTLDLNSSNEFIAEHYFDESQCISHEHILPSPDINTLIMSSRVSPNAMAILVTGDTSYAQNQLSILQSKKDGRTEHIMPPGPGNIAMEDVFSLASKQQPVHHAEDRAISEQQMIPGLSTLGRPLNNTLNARGSSIYPSPLEGFSLFLRICVGAFFLCVGFSSTYGVFYINQILKQTDAFLPSISLA